MTEILILANKLKKAFGHKIAVDNLSLQVRAGEIYGLVGPDGAGKTTTMRLLCGAMEADSGEIVVNGYSIATHPDTARKQLGYLSQKFSFYEELTVLENIRFFAEVRGIPGRDWANRAMEILEFVGLSAFVNRRAGHLSGGMKQKLGLASALVHRPRVLLLDEPTSGVDPITRQDFWQLIIHLVTEDDVSVLVSTPYMDEAVRCTFVGFMQGGQLIIEDKPKNLQQRLDGRIVELRGEPLKVLRNLALADEDVAGVQAFGDRLHLRTQPNCANQVMTRLRNKIQHCEAKIDRMMIVSPSLEDVFIELLEK